MKYPSIFRAPVVGCYGRGGAVAAMRDMRRAHEPVAVMRSAALPRQLRTL